jgi:hypothetical protein
MVRYFPERASSKARSRVVLLFCNPVPYFASDFRSLKPAPPPFPHNTNRAAQRERAFGQTDVTSERKFVSPEIAALGVKLGDAVGTLPAALFAGDFDISRSVCIFLDSGQLSRYLLVKYAAGLVGLRCAASPLLIRLLLSRGEGNEHHDRRTGGRRHSDVTGGGIPPALVKASVSAEDDARGLFEGGAYARISASVLLR